VNTTTPSCDYVLTHSFAQASASGIFQEEILPIEIRGAVISVDDTVRPGVTAEGLATLKPSFPQWGTASTTAGNASGIGDGAAICVMTTRERAEREGMDIVGKWVSSAVVGKALDFCGSSVTDTLLTRGSNS
jgi:acetyl-CoA acyltransferase 1